ncbi:ATP-dependent helicase, partial [Nocardiopsis flavescens]
RRSSRGGRSRRRTRSGEGVTTGAEAPVADKRAEEPRAQAAAAPAVQTAAKAEGGEGGEGTRQVRRRRRTRGGSAVRRDPENT